MGARHPGRSGHYQAGLHNAGPSAPADWRSHRGTGHCEKQWARVSSYGDAAKLLQVGRQRRDIGPGKGASKRSAAQGPASNDPGEGK